jgi:hypothetical protein
MLIIMTITICGVLLMHRQQTQPAQAQSLLKDVTGLTLAAQSYSRDHVSRGQPLPSSISLQDLVNSGYISAADIRAFDGMIVTIYPIDVDTYPQSVLIRMQLSDGRQITAMADGSIQQKAR